MEVLLLPLQRRDLCASALCCVGGDATDEEEGKSLLDWNGIKIVETDCMLPIDRVKPYARNAKRHPQEQIDEIKASIKRFGMDDPIGIWGKENLIVEGHGRLEACKQLGIPTVPCIRLDHLTKEERKAYTLAHNKTNMDSGWDFTALDQELAEIVDIDMSEFGFGAPLPEEEIWQANENSISLADKYTFAPFSVLDGRSGEWQKRKKQWHSVIGDSREGRPDSLIGSLGSLAKAQGHKYSGTSEFDPVLCEVLVKWFCPPNGKIVDPFAGGNVRGVISAILGNEYHGVDIRQEQIAENESSLQKIRADYAQAPKWHCGDSANIDAMLSKEAPFDFFLMCPPYGDLEKYSDDPKDLSTKKYEDFIVAYRDIIKKTAALLSENAFCAVVVSDIRDRKGMYRGFTAETIKAFTDCGAKLYNDIVKLDSTCGAAVRVEGQFRDARKVVRVHQNVLVFVKGDPRRIKKGEYEFDFGESEAENA